MEKYELDIAKFDKDTYNKVKALRITNDRIFKNIFGKKKNRKALIYTVNTVLEDDGFSPVVSLQLDKSDFPGAIPKEKSSVLDLVAQDETGAIFNIEMQSYHEKAFEYRSVLYGTKLYSHQLETNEVSELLRPVICINFVDFDLFKGETEFHSCFVFTEVKRKYLTLPNGIRTHFIEIPKAIGKTGKLAELVLLFKEIKADLSDQILNKINENPIYEVIYGGFMHSIQTKSALYAALSREKFIMSMHGQLEYIKDELREKGKEEGREEGRAEGRVEGFIEGQKEQAKKIADILKAQGDSIEKIMQATGLSADEINE